MKLPRNISGQELVKILTRLGYQKVPQILTGNTIWQFPTTTRSKQAH